MRNSHRPWSPRQAAESTHPWPVPDLTQRTPPTRRVPHWRSHRKLVASARSGDSVDWNSVERRIRISVGELELGASLTASATASAIWEALPLARSVNTWGDEFYFDIGVPAELEPGARDVVEVGTLAYWPPGQAFCIFFGPTPASQGDEVRARQRGEPDRRVGRGPGGRVA